MSYNHIFLLKNERISVFRLRENTWEQCRKDGLATFPIDAETDLWNWWKELSGYIDSETVDLLFLSDKPHKWQPDLPFSKETIWSLRTLEDFCERFLDMPEVDLIISDRNPLRIKNRPAAKLPTLEKPAIFYVYPPLKKAPIKDIKNKNNDTLYMYFRRINEENEKRNQK